MARNSERACAIDAETQNFNGSHRATKKYMTSKKEWFLHHFLVPIRRRSDVELRDGHQSFT